MAVVAEAEVASADGEGALAVGASAEVEAGRVAVAGEVGEVHVVRVRRVCASAGLVGAVEGEEVGACPQAQPKSTAASNSGDRRRLIVSFSSVVSGADGVALVDEVLELSRTPWRRAGRRGNRLGRRQPGRLEQLGQSANLTGRRSGGDLCQDL